MNAFIATENNDRTIDHYYGHYCDIETYTPPRVFISQHKHLFRVVQLAELPRYSPPVKKTLWQQWINKYWAYVGNGVTTNIWKTTATIVVMVVVVWSDCRTSA